MDYLDLVLTVHELNNSSPLSNITANIFLNLFLMQLMRFCTVFAQAVNERRQQTEKNHVFLKVRCLKENLF